MNIKKNKKITIGFQISEISSGLSDIHMTLLEGINECCKELEINLFCFVGQIINGKAPFTEITNKIYDLTSERSLDGLITWPTYMSYNKTKDETIDFYKKYEPLPIVSIGLPISFGTAYDNFSAVLLDNEATVNSLMDHLTEFHKFTKIAFVPGPIGHYESDARYSCFKEYLSKRKIVFNKELVYDFNKLTVENGQKAVRSFFIDKNFTPKTDIEAIFCANDMVAAGCIGELEKIGIKVPDDVAVVGVDNKSICKTVYPTITSVDLNFNEIGKNAVIKLVDLINGRKSQDTYIKPKDIVIRRSCGCFEKSISSIFSASKVNKGKFDLLTEENLFDKILNDKLSEFRNIIAQIKPSDLKDILESFIKSVRSDSEKSFLSVLGNIINKNKSDTMSWQDFITLFRNIVLSETLTDKIVEVESLFHEARVMIELFIENDLSSMNIRLRQLSHKIPQVMNIIDSTFELDILLKNIEKSLIELNISNCYISTYENVDTPLDKSKLIFAFKETRRFSLNNKETVFNTMDLLPEYLLEGNSRFSNAVYPLRFQSENIGFIIYEINDKNKVYESITGTIGNALHGSLLITDIRSTEDKMEELLDMISLKNTELEQMVGRLGSVLDGIIEAISIILEKKDPYTAGHQRRVSDLATNIARKLDLDNDTIDAIKYAGIIHDVGKIAIPIEILSKPGKLDELEFMLIKKHSQVGYDILKNIEFPWAIADIVYQHHERLDGLGYPNFLKADQIRLEAKILSVADVVEAIASHRPYRAALGISVAIDEITKFRGNKYDSKVVDACLEIITDPDFKFHDYS